LWWDTFVTDKRTPRAASQSWADEIAQKLTGRGLLRAGICLILGGSDTGKTTLAAALAKHAASSKPVGIVDADVGQSHIGPPTTVGWAIVEPDRIRRHESRGVDTSHVDFSQLEAGGISFVGDITPVGHLLQLTAAVNQCVRQASKHAEIIIVDTPGFIFGPAASILWWTVQQMLQPEIVLAVQRNDELSNILAGLHCLELINSPSQVSSKSPEDRRGYRQSRFAEYYKDSQVSNINLTDVAVQATGSPGRRDLVNRLVGLRSQTGTNVAIGVITDWQPDKSVAVVRTPKVDIRQIRCLVIGDVTLGTAAARTQ
jgi:polynucleotide 5'-hydroxyl-kinase GRC3/NOL9